MTQPTSVTVEGMQRAVSNMDNAKATATSDRSRIEGELGGLRAAWTGEAATVFQQAGQAWLDNMQQIIQGLESLSAAMGQGGQSYQQTHQTTIDASQRAQSAIAGAAPTGLTF